MADVQAGAGAQPRTIALCMIVKNEAHILRRCIEAARPLLDYVLIADTGSTDGTVEVAREVMDDLALPGEVVQHPWRDFAHNRSRALAALRERRDVDYALMIDADDRVEFSDGFDIVGFKASLAADVYNVTTRMSAVRYLRPQLISNRKPFHFRAVLHEYLDCAEGFSRGAAEGFHVVAVQDGARSHNANKYRDDAATLERALQTETDPFLQRRYTFYLAQSHRDCGEVEKSIEVYLQRARMGDWEQEIYCSLLYAARQMANLERPAEEVLRIYMQAAELCQDRAEALHGASRLCRLAGQHARGAAIAERGLELQPPADGLFVEPWIYRYGLRDEFAVNAYWADRPRDCLASCIELLGLDELPSEDRLRIAANARFALDKLA